MKKVSICSTLINSIGEKTKCNVIGKYDFQKKKLFFIENNISVLIEFIGNKVKIKRKNSDYCLNLLFEKNKTTKTRYKVNALNVEFEVEISTQEKEISDKNIKLDYRLYLNGEDMGNFEYKLDFEVIK